ncbi:hypothetical protein BKA81DRAFT_36370 [Phyllosticta paracitricarpa]|uniref:Uncharacterized protein n=1 Tax=Phyllosticta paracitricarpa TaxID=2016321 RepID=A0ABR1N421_9PEZI
MWTVEEDKGQRATEVRTGVWDMVRSSSRRRRRRRRKARQGKGSERNGQPRDHKHQQHQGRAALRWPGFGMSFEGPKRTGQDSALHVTTFMAIYLTCPTMLRRCISPACFLVPCRRHLIVAGGHMPATSPPAVLCCCLFPACSHTQFTAQLVQVLRCSSVRPISDLHHHGRRLLQFLIH